MLVPHDALVLALDGERVQLLRNIGSLGAPRLELLHKERTDIPPDRAVMADRPGRSFESASPTRHGYEVTSPRDRAEKDFGMRALALLDAAGAQDVPVVLIAPPHMLGLMRSLMSAAQQRRTIAEIDKDFAHRTVADITAFLSDYPD